MMISGRGALAVRNVRNRATIVVLAAAIGVASAAPLPDLFELEGDILDGAAVSPDWASLFVVDSAPHGTVTGIVLPLPASGIDAAFRRDPLAISGLDKIDCTVFAAGNKNGDRIADWEFKAGSVPPKDDLSNVMAYLRDDGSGGLELFLSLERYAENGDSHVDFEINQGAIGTVVDVPGAGCPGDGHFVGDRLLNDLLVAVDFERGGGLSMVRVFRYLNETELQLLIQQSVGGASQFCNTATTAGGLSVPAGAVCVSNNAGTIDGGPWANFNRSNSRGPVTTLPRNAFTELGIRLGDLPGNIGAAHCIRTINAKTRSSQSITSELKDFALIQFDTCADIAGRKLEVADDGTCGSLVGPLPNWQVRLLDASGNLITQDGDGNALVNPTCTDGEGRYRFSNLPHGRAYTVCEVIPDRRTGAAAENFEWAACEPSAAVGRDGAAVSDGHCEGQNGGVEYCHPALTLRSNVADLDFRNARQIVACDLAAVAFCDVDGGGDYEPPVDDPRDGFCLCVTRLVDGAPDASTTQCGVTADGAFVVNVATGHSYRVEEDLSGVRCGSEDRSDGWINSSGSQDVFADPDAAGSCEAKIGNASNPVITCPADVVFECDAVGPYGDATATNECGEATIGVDEAVTPGLCPQEYDVLRTHTATTGAGLTDSCEQTVNVVDTTAPELTCPPDLTVECGVITPYGEPTVRDNCVANPTVTLVETEFPGDCTPEEPLGAAAGISPPPKLSVVRNFTASDATATVAAASAVCGNTSTCTQIVQIVDTTPPEITCPPDLTFECDNIGDFGVATATDTCDVVSIDEPIVVETPGGCPGERTITRTFTARDECGLTASCTQTIYVVDTTAPVVTCPADLTVECGGPGDYGDATATDNCDPDPQVVVDVIEIPGDCTAGEPSGAVAGISPPPKLTVVRDFRATDAGTAAAAVAGSCGNIGSCTQIVTIVDTTAPEITCPPDLVFECDNVGDFGVATARDVCGTVTIDDPLVIETPGACPGERTITRTFTARDECGLTSSCTQTIQVVDTTPPVVTCPPDVTVECGTTTDFGEPTVTDNCDPDPQVTVEVIEIPGDCSQNAAGSVAGISPPPKLTVVRNFTGTDGSTTAAAAAAGTCGNVSTCTQIVTIIDTAPPVVTACPSNASVGCNEPFPFSIPSTDTCEGGLTIECFFADAANPDRFTAVRLGEDSWELTLTLATTVSVACIATDECDNASDACAFQVSATCNQACSPGFWRNNLSAWCLTPFNPTANYCFTGGATPFLDAFGLASCPNAPSGSAIAANPALTLLQAVSSSGGNNQTLFHGSAALLSSYAVSFPAEPDTVRAVMRDACTGSTDYDGLPMSWTRAFAVFLAWNQVEAEGGCPITTQNALTGGEVKASRERQ